MHAGQTKKTTDNFTRRCVPTLSFDHAMNNSFRCDAMGRDRSVCPSGSGIAHNEIPTNDARHAAARRARRFSRLFGNQTTSQHGIPIHRG